MGETEILTEEKTALDLPWNVVVHDDPVNLMDYVTWVFMKVFSYPKARAETLMLEVHQLGRSIVWTGGRERAELYTQQLQGFQLKTSMEKVEG
jgi:ATP-dependent Clp protease adaptor protein ClpS